MIDPQISLLWVEIATTAEDNELEAAAAAFALVAAVDHDVSPDEIARFAELVPSQGRGSHVRSTFDSHVLQLKRDFKAGRKAAFQRLEAVAGTGVPADRVLRIAQMAVVADHQIDEAEEGILQEIAKALGFSDAGRA